MVTNLDVEGVVYPDIVLPVQHTARFKQLTPERRLMIAVLDDAIHCVAKYRLATDGLGRRLFAEETEWLLSPDTRWPYSFESICEMLDLDPVAVRAGLRLRSNPPPGPELHGVDLAESQPRDRFSF